MPTDLGDLCRFSSAVALLPPPSLCPIDFSGDPYTPPKYCYPDPAGEDLLETVPPCPTITEKGLNESRSADIAAIDWSYAGLQEREVESFQAALSTDSGVILAGDRYTVHENGRSAKGRTATAAYSRLVDAPTCYVGGCSNQVCSDQEGVITTCEWQPQYACYASATCERQADGTCGWTATPELDACLAQY